MPYFKFDSEIGFQIIGLQKIVFRQIALLLASLENKDGW